MADQEQKPAWVAKYALTQGVTELTAAYEVYSGYLRPKGSWNSLLIGRDVFFTKEEALARAEELRNKKIKSLKAQLAKLEKTAFN